MDKKAGKAKTTGAGVKSKASHKKPAGQTKPSGGKKGKKSGMAKKDKGAVAEQPARCEGILCPAAMDNLYYIAHDAADALVLRGFRWKYGKRKKGRKKGKR